MYFYNFSKKKKYYYGCSQPWGVVDLNEISRGKFQVAKRRASVVHLHICVKPSSIPWELKKEKNYKPFNFPFFG